MSLKVWTAYKLRRPSQFWPMATFIRQRGEAEVRALLRKIYVEWGASIDPKNENYLKTVQEYLNNDFLVKQVGKRKIKSYVDRGARLALVNKALRDGYRTSVTDPHRSVFDFNVSVTCREYKGGIYLIPYCGSGVSKALDFLRKDKRLQDYHYQNQADKPKSVSAAAWEERRLVWEPLTEPDLWLNFVVIEISSWDGWWQLDPYMDMRVEMTKEWKK